MSLDARRIDLASKPIAPNRNKFHDWHSHTSNALLTIIDDRHVESRTLRVGQAALDQPTRERFRPVARFRDRLAIVTGAGAPGGIGAAVAREFVAEGGRVVLGATSERVHQRVAELGDAAVGVIADLTVDGAADRLVRAALDRWGRVDVLVNNAGMTSVSSGWDADDDVAEMSLAAWDAALARNLTTAFLMCRSVVPLMTAAGYGRIVSIGSTTGTVNAMPGQSTYTAAKAGLV